jgi:flagellar FliL protein
MAAIRPGRPAKKAAKAAPAQPPADAAPPPPAAPAGKSRSMTVPAIVLAVAVLGAAFMMKGGGDGGGGTVEASTTDSTVAEAKAGETVSLDAITTNLASGDIVKVGIALQLTEGSVEAEEAVEDPKNFGARALDELITVLGGYSRDDLSREGGLADLKAKLTERVKKAYHDEVVTVLLTQFVIA